MYQEMPGRRRGLCVNCAEPERKHNVNGECPSPRTSHRSGITWGALVAVLILIAAIYVGLHIVNAESSKNSPPAACQLVGGHWDIWHGWRCG